MHRRAFSISPLIWLLVLVLAGLLAWRGWVKVSNAPARGTFGHRSGYSTGVVTGSIFLGLVCIAVAGGVGAFAFFASRRSDQVSNLAMGGVLLLPIGLFSYQGCSYLTHDPRQPGRTSGQPSAAVPSPPGFDPRPTRPIAPSPAPAASPDRSVRNPGTPAPAVLLPPSSAAFAAVAEYIGAEDPTVKQVLITLGAELESDIAALAAILEAEAPALAKVPRRHRNEIREKAGRFAEIRTQAAAVESRTKDADEEAERRLVQAGVATIDARSASMQFAGMTRSVGRSFAAADVVRFCDDGIEECGALDAGFGRWKINAAGEIEAEDFALRAKLGGPRLRLESFADRLRSVLEQLRAG